MSLAVFCTDNTIAKIDQIKRTRHGLPWSCEDYDKLQVCVEDGFTLEAMCNYLQRPAAGVIAKMRDKYLTSCNGYYFWKNVNQPETPTQPETKLENTMTQPLQTLTLIFGNDIKKCSELDLISVIQKCKTEIDSYDNIPSNKWVANRKNALHDAINAAVEELNTRA